MTELGVVATLESETGADTGEEGEDNQEDEEGTDDSNIMRPAIGCRPEATPHVDVPVNDCTVVADEGGVRHCNVGSEHGDP